MLQVERLRYQAALAERRFDHVDPDNRLVAAELEQRWETALRELRQAEEALARRRAARAIPETLTPEERDGFLALGPRLPTLWQEPGMPRAQRKALLRCLIDKVVLRRVASDRISVRIVWLGGEVAELAVEPAVHALHALSRGAEMETRLLELARQGVDDATIAALLTREGHRSARRGHVPVRTVQLVRQRHRVLRRTKQRQPRHPPGRLSVTELAIRLKVSRHWIHRRIGNGTITVGRDAATGRYLFPDTRVTLASFQELRAGKLECLSFTRHPDK
jgi:hypothetical protein